MARAISIVASRPANAYPASPIKLNQLSLFLNLVKNLFLLYFINIQAPAWTRLIGVIVVNIVQGIPGNRADLGSQPFVWGINWFPEKTGAVVEALVVRYCPGQNLPVFFGSFYLARRDLGGDDLVPWYGTDEEDVVFSYDDASGLELPRKYGKIYRFDPTRAPADTEKYVLYVQPIGDTRSVTLELVLPSKTLTLAYNDLPVDNNPLRIGSIVRVHSGSWHLLIVRTKRMLTDQHSLFAIAARAEADSNFEQ